MKLQNRARFYAKVTALLFSKKDLRGRVATATRGARHISLGIRLSNPLTLDTALVLAEPLALATNTPAVIAQRRPDNPGLVSYQFQLARGYWQSYTRQDVTGLGVGLGDSRTQIDFSFDPPQALVAGTTGSGKTETVKSILVGLCAAYSPDNLNLVMIDWKREYNEFDNLAHLAVPVARDEEEIDSTITWIGREFIKRKDHQANGKKMVIVLDEGENVLTNDKQGKKRLAPIQQIAKIGRSFDMHILFITQEPQKGLVKELKGQLLNRWIGQVQDARTSSDIAGHPGLQCHKLTGKGDFLHIDGPDNQRFQVALATDRDYERLPRVVEVPPLQLEEEDTLPVINLPAQTPEPSRAPGRPVNQVDPLAVAYYIWHGPDRITRNLARQALGLARYNHVAHRDFAQAVADELKRFYAAKGTAA